jgi:hypothetical protein
VLITVQGDKVVEVHEIDQQVALEFHLSCSGSAAEIIWSPATNLTNKRNVEFRSVVIDCVICKLVVVHSSSVFEI